MNVEYRKFHTPGAGNLNSIKKNAIFIREKNNKKEHEIMKFELAWEAKTNGDVFITEAARKATEEEKKMFGLTKDKVVDFVNLSQQQEYEIIYKHESDQQIKFYRANGTIPIIVGEKITCEICKQDYPRRSKKNICMNCRGVE